MILHPIIDLLKRIIVALPDYAGGGIDNGVEWTINASNVVTNAKVIGNTVPDRAFSYGFYGQQTAVIVDLSNVSIIGQSAFANSNGIKIDFDTGINIETIKNDGFNMSPGIYNDMSDQVLNMPKLDGRTCGQQIFRGLANAYGPKTYDLPVLYEVPLYMCYGMSTQNVDITLGSVGNPIVSSKSQPFAASTNASGTITVYTTGSYLDTIKTAIQNGAGAGLTFIYKASEDTTYNGVSYSAGDTMLTV